jgi:hypothetical protein
LVHDHLQSCCSCCCQIWEHAGSLPRLISHSSLTHKHICNINTHTHTHIHKQTTTTTCTQEREINRVQYKLDAHLCTNTPTTMGQSNMATGPLPIVWSIRLMWQPAIGQELPRYITYILLPSDNFCTSLIPLCTFLVTS